MTPKKLMSPKSIANFLEKNKIKHEVLEHKTVFTAFDKSATLKEKPAIIGKGLILCFNGKDYALGLVPANKNLDKAKTLAAMNKIRQKAKEKDYKKVDFAKETWVKNNFKNCKPGANPPFGDLYGMPLIMDNSLAKQTKIIVNGGSYEISLKIPPKELEKGNNALIKAGIAVARK